MARRRLGVALEAGAFAVWFGERVEQTFEGGEVGVVGGGGERFFDQVIARNIEGIGGAEGVGLSRSCGRICAMDGLREAAPLLQPRVKFRRAGEEGEERRVVALGGVGKSPPRESEIDGLAFEEVEEVLSERD